MLRHRSELLQLANGCGTVACNVDWTSTYLLCFGTYALWQLLYLLKTEVLDKHKFKRDLELQVRLARPACRRPSYLHAAGPLPPSLL